MPQPTIPSAWPSVVQSIFERAITTEYASLTGKLAPLTYPVTPYIGQAGTLDISTGLTYPTKAERARRNPKVALLYSDPVGSGLKKPPVVLVQGMAAVRDADLQANTDRYIREGVRKLPEAYQGTPTFMLARMPWYFVRIWIEVTPLRMLWWPDGDLAREPESWQASPALAIPTSDPAPQGKTPGKWTEGASDWRPGMRLALEQLGHPVLTTVDTDGYPLPRRVCRATMTGEQLSFDLPAGLPTPADGPACLTFHTHPEAFTGQQNMVFSGQIQNEHFLPEKQLGDWSLAGSKLQAMWTFMSNGRKLAPRLMQEAQRRGQPVPKIKTGLFRG